MEFTKAAVGDKAQIKSMWEYCFSDSPQYVKWYFDNIYKQNQTYCIKEQGKISANLQLLPFEVSMQKQLPATFMIGVASRPESRGSGNVRNLINHTLNQMYQEQIALSLLVPFDFDFYKKFGYEVCAFLTEHKGKINDLAKYAKFGASMIEVENPEHLDPIYKSFMKDKNLCLNIKWRDVASALKIEGSHAFMLPGRGYILYGIAHNTMYVHEMIYTNMDALKEMLCFIYRHSAQAENYVIKDADHRILLEELCGKNVVSTTFPYAMGRIVNAKTILEALSTEFDGDISLEINDPIIHQNNQCLRITQGKAEKTNSGLPIDISVLSALAAGALSFEGLYNRGVVKNRELVLLFPEKTSFLNFVGFS